MRIHDILGSPPFIVIGIAIARALPRKLGYGVSRYIARGMARRRAQLFRNVRGNLAHVMGPDTDAQQLDAMAEQAIYHAGCTYLDMFRASVEDYRRGRISLELDQEAWDRALEAMRDGRGTVLVGPHMSNFDLAAQWIEARGIHIRALSLSEPNLGTQLINRLREHRGIDMMPIDIHALRQAMQTLRSGGLIMTGVDRPTSSEDTPLTFFGKPARLPTGHVRLALQTDAHMVVACCLQKSDGTYALQVVGPLEMERTGNKTEDVRVNAEKVLAVIEGMIRQAPEQWLMFLPVWESEDV
jgi:lauroyl/myristoyl acyltransferase